MDVVGRIAELRARAQRHTRNVYDTYFTRRVSIYITAVLYVLGVSANAVSAFSMLVVIAACSLIGLGTGWQLYLGVACMHLFAVLDSVDGELARLRFQYSKVGQWLDNLSDDLVDNAFVAGVGVALGGVWLYVALAGVAARVVVALYIYISVYRRTGTGDIFAFRWWFESDAATPDEVFKPSLRTYLRSLGRRDTYVFLWMIVCLASFPEWVVGHAAVIGAVYAALMLLQLTVFRRR